MIPTSDNAEKSTTPMHNATIYPTTSPNKTESCLKYDFANILKIIQHSNVIVPSIQFCTEPKSAFDAPPPNESAPTDKSENPIAVTTVAATIGDTILIQYLDKSPSIPSTIPPISTAPIIAPYPYFAPITHAIDTNVNEIPITIGSLDPILHIGKSCINVPIPAIIIAL